MKAFQVAAFVVALVAFNVAARSEELCAEKFDTLDQLQVIIEAKAGLKTLQGDDTFLSYSDPATDFIWNFATNSNPAFPSVACRRIVEVEGRYHVETRIHCAADKSACDQLSAAYNALDQKMLEFLNKR